MTQPDHLIPAVTDGLHRCQRFSLHHDFRLAPDGTIKRWVTPKRPSFEPSDKRMAVRAEGHQLVCADFQGIVPARTGVVDLHAYGELALRPRAGAWPSLTPRVEAVIFDTDWLMPRN